MNRANRILLESRKKHTLFTFRDLREGFRRNLREDVEAELADSRVDPTGDVVQSLYVRDTLPPSLFPDGEEMDPRVLEALRRIADDFVGGIDALPEGFEPEDIVVVGSAVSYSWSKYSDIDLHVIVNFSEVDENLELVRDYLQYAKAAWNDRNAPVVGGFSVEVYLEDASEPNVSPGKYSVLRGEWETFPEKSGVPEPDVSAVVDKAASVMQRVYHAMDKFEGGDVEGALELADEIKADIRKMRQTALEREGVFSVENLAFKVLRRNGTLELLSNLKQKAKNAALSFEATTESRSRFGRSRNGIQGGTYRCRSCGRLTRETDQYAASCQLCGYCHEESELKNSLSDGTITEEDYGAAMEEIRRKYRR